MGRLREHLTYANVGVTILLGVAVTSGATAMAEQPVATAAASATANAKKALKIAKRADKRAKQALADAGTPGSRGQTGATGATGPQGPGGERGAQGEQGPKGDTGAQGHQGLKGDPGQDGATNAIVRPGGVLTAGANGTGPGCVDGVPGGSKGFRDAANALVSCGGGAGGAAATIAQCAAGEVATGGGYAFSGGKRHALVTESRPNPSGAGQTPTGWFVRVETLTNDASNNTPVTTYAVCVSP